MVAKNQRFAKEFVRWKIIRPIPDRFTDHSQSNAVKHLSHRNHSGRQFDALCREVGRCAYGVLDDEPTARRPRPSIGHSARPIAKLIYLEAKRMSYDRSR